MSIASIAGQVREQLNPEPFQVGQIVIARFTNSGSIRQFEGVVLGRTKNYWKVKAITTPYENEQPGRIYHIATPASRIYSLNNRIVMRVYQPEA